VRHSPRPTPMRNRVHHLLAFAQITRPRRRRRPGGGILGDSSEFWGDPLMIRPVSGVIHLVSGLTPCPGSGLTPFPTKFWGDAFGPRIWWCLLFGLFFFIDPRPQNAFSRTEPPAPPAPGTKQLPTKIHASDELPRGKTMPFARLTENGLRVSEAPAQVRCHDPRGGGGGGETLF